MPPNVKHSWDSNTSKRHFRGIPVHVDDDNDDDNDQYHHPEFNAKLFLPPKNCSKQSTPSDDDGRNLWEKIWRNDTDLAIGDDDEEINVTNSSELLASLSSIIILNDEAGEKDWLNRFGGRLSNVSSELLEGLRKYAPDLNNMSTVADFNDNLFYHAQQEQGLKHFSGLNSSYIEELEAVVHANEYLGSFLTTKSSLPQPPHVDYPWEVLEKHSGDQSLKIGFFPLTEEGMFLQIWPTIGPSENPPIEVEGQIIFIPHGKLLTIPASTIHGGGFRTTELREKNDNNSQSGNSGRSGNLRFHLYIATNQASLPAHQTNKYTEPCDKTKELSRRYVDSKHMKVLLQSFFV